MLTQEGDQAQRPFSGAELQEVCYGVEEHLPSTGNHFFQTVCPAQMTKKDGPALEPLTKGSISCGMFPMLTHVSVGTQHWKE